MSAITTSRVKGHRLGVKVALLVVLVTTAMAWSAASASAYEGVFCNGVPLKLYHRCFSSLVEELRRAIAHGNAGWTLVHERVGGWGERQGECFSSGCTANTGYTGGGGSGEAYEENIGIEGTHTYYGYIYK